MDHAHLRPEATQRPGRPLVPLLTRCDWLEIGDSRDRSAWPRLPHDRACRPFAVRGVNGTPYPYLTRRDLQDLVASGRYASARNRRPDPALRPPQEIWKLAAGEPHELPADGLTWEEATLACTLLGGWMANETEADLISRRLGEAFDHGPVWTDTDWSAWSYRIIGYDAAVARWRAFPDRLLPSSGTSASLVAMFCPGDPPYRVPGCRRAGIPAAPSAFPQFGSTWLVVRT